MKLPWKWIIFGVIILFALLAIAYGGSGYKIARDWIVADRDSIQRELESDNTRLNKERDQYLRQISQLQQERVRLNGEYRKLKDKYDALEDQMVHIIVPIDPNELVLAYHKRGFKSAYLLRQR